MSRPFSNHVTLASNLSEDTRRKLLNGIRGLRTRPNDRTQISNPDPDPAAVGPSLEPSYTLYLANFLMDAAKLKHEARDMGLEAKLKANWDVDVVRTCEGDSGGDGGGGGGDGDGGVVAPSLVGQRSDVR